MSVHIGPFLICVAHPKHVHLLKTYVTFRANHHNIYSEKYFPFPHFAPLTEVILIGTVVTYRNFSRSTPLLFKDLLDANELRHIPVTVTTKLHVPIFPAASEASHVTLVFPNKKVSSDV